MFLKMSLLLNSAVALAAPTTVSNVHSEQKNQTEWNCGGENILKSEAQNSVILWEEAKFWETAIQDTWTNFVNHQITVTHAGINRIIYHLENGRAGSLLASLIIFKRPFISSAAIGNIVAKSHDWKNLDKGKGVEILYLFGIFQTYAWAR